MSSKLNRLFHTIKHLKPVQLVYQVWYRLKKPLKLSSYGKGYLGRRLSTIKFSRIPPVEKYWNGGLKFTFLNQSVDFESQINWNYQSNGKLWNYNLQYASYLLQGDISLTEKDIAMEELYQWLTDGRLALEPYPASLRIMNMIRWLCYADMYDSPHIPKVYAEVDFLSRRLEYHLLGNHLLENAFALLMGGVFFGEGKWEAKAKKLLINELNEQVLTDGAHFELSPMYHQIIFFRLLELIDWYSNYYDRDKDFLRFCRNKASLMYTWMNKICFDNGDIPLFNDAANGIAYGADFLRSYACLLDIAPATIELGSSGYRSYETELYEIKVDAGQLGPLYQPGHAHADALSFIVHYKKRPVFVEYGTSTYHPGGRREIERSTQAHNTVVVNKMNQSDVWGGFRVGKKAKTTILKESSNHLEAFHNGYSDLGINHIRSFVFGKSYIEISDILTKESSAEFHLHLHPNCKISHIDGNEFLVDQDIRIKVKESIRIEVVKYDFSDSYNKYATGYKLIIFFNKNLNIKFLFNE